MRREESEAARMVMKIYVERKKSRGRLKKKRMEKIEHDKRSVSVCKGSPQVVGRKTKKKKKMF